MVLVGDFVGVMTFEIWGKCRHHLQIDGLLPMPSEKGDATRKGVKRPPIPKLDIHLCIKSVR